MKRLMLAAMAVLGLFVGGLIDTHPQADAAPTKSVIFLHGRTGSGSQWNTAAAQYKAAGYTTYQLNLPYNGGHAGDTVKNAAYVNNFIAQNHLTNVQLDAHSLGGTLAFYLGRVSRNSAITSIVTRDSNINTSGDTGLACWFVPDQCAGSAVRTSIFNSQPTLIPIETLISQNVADPETDCLFVYPGMAHNTFLTDKSVTAHAINWANGVCQ